MNTGSRSSLWLGLGSVMAGTAVAAGAFGAHSLEACSRVHVGVFETAVRYQMYHALGLAPSLGGRSHPESMGDHRMVFRRGDYSVLGSLYMVSWAIQWPGAITPLGG